MFTPPDVTNTIEMPGNNGGANFQGAALDPVHGKLFVVSKDLPALLNLAPSSYDAADASFPPDRSPEERGRHVYESKCNCVMAPSWQYSQRLYHHSWTLNRD
jgi:quinoprotein glucose dehydrogenase